MYSIGRRSEYTVWCEGGIFVPTYSSIVSRSKEERLGLWLLNALTSFGGHIAGKRYSIYSCLYSKDLKGYDRHHVAKDTAVYCIASQPLTATFFDQAQAYVLRSMYLTRKVRLMNTASSAPGGPARCRSNAQAATLQSSSATFRLSLIHI